MTMTPPPFDWLFYCPLAFVAVLGVLSSMFAKDE